MSRARRVARGEVGRLRLGFTESASFNPVFTRLLADYRSRWPNIALTLAEGHTTALASGLLAGDLDAAFVRPPLPRAEGLVFRMLAVEPLRVAIPSGHRLSSRTEVELRELADEMFVVYPRTASSGLSDAIVSACMEAGFTPRVAQEAPQLSSTVNFVAAALGVAIVPECMRRLRPESVRFLRLTGRLPTAALGLATSDDAGSAALDHLRRLAEEFPSRAP